MSQYVQGDSNFNITSAKAANNAITLESGGSTKTYTSIPVTTHSSFWTRDQSTIFSSGYIIGTDQTGMNNSADLRVFVGNYGDVNAECIDVTDSVTITKDWSFFEITIKNFPDSVKSKYAQPVVILAKVQVTPTTVKLTQTLTGMESDKTGDTLPINEAFTINLSALAPVDEWGNPIDGAPKPPIQKVTSTVGTVSIDREAGTATITGNATKDVEIVGIAKNVIVYTSKGTFKNCSCNYTDGETFDANKPVEVTANTGYYFNGTYYVIYPDNDSFSPVQFTVSQDKTKLTYTPDDATAGKDLYLSSNYNAVELPAHYVYFSDSALGTASFVNCSCNYTNGEKLKADKVVTITADPGYFFQTDFEYAFDDIGTVTRQFTKSADGSTLTIPTPPDADVKLFQKYEAITKIVSISGFVNLYSPTADELQALSKERFYTLSAENTVDYGQFITAVYVCPLEIPAENLGDKGTINLGKFNATTKATLLKNYRSNVPCGTISVPAKYNNVYDYINTTCTLYIPFFAPIVLQNDFVIGQTVTVDLVIDWYSGTASYNVSSTFNNAIFASGTANIVTQIPFIQKQNNTVVNQISNVANYTVDTARIEVTRNKPYHATGSIFGKPVIEFVTIGDLAGYAEFSNVELIGNATETEKKNIESLLKSGVFINGNP